ncbi:uncharacterized protein A4U43_C04F14760 [Asparagus officinalis]|uniref:Uncharacterized protein n=1 Tax=Asparagus officinalis TaxID=4686 RepID=A0A5P1F0X9_ASPOF|nr:uncharacterized protein A4U43_C04F14760 [Asparagus officinalis]
MSGPIQLELNRNSQARHLLFTNEVAKKRPGLRKQEKKKENPTQTHITRSKLQRENKILTQRAGNLTTAHEVVSLEKPSSCKKIQPLPPRRQPKSKRKKKKTQRVSLERERERDRLRFFPLGIKQ